MTSARTCAIGEEGAPIPAGPLTVSLEGWEGPLDLLLELAREQKVDLARISILRLAEQYLEWIGRARALDLEVAADHLVMAAWLAYLKSRLLLPPLERPADEPSAEAAAEALASHLRRLQAMREAGAALMARTRLGVEVWPRGAPETRIERVPGGWAVSLTDLIAAYAAARRRAMGRRRYTLPPLNLMSVQDALARLTRLLRVVPEWSVLTRFLPPNLAAGLPMRAGVAAMLVAGLELAKGRALCLRQDEPFGPIWVKARPEPEAGA